jgi:hypothetical protein
LWLSAAVGVTRALGTRPLSLVFEMTRADGRDALEADCGEHTVFDAIQTLTPDSAAAA